MKTPDLLSGVESLIATHQQTRAPTVAQILESASTASTARLNRADHSGNQIPDACHEQASPEDVRRLRDLGDKGIFWDGRLGMFHAMTPNDCGTDLARRSWNPCHRSDITSAWLRESKAKAKPLIVAQQAELGEAPF